MRNIFLAAGVFIGSAAVLPATNVYTINTTIVSATPSGNPLQSDTISGTLTTDGTIGVLGSTNILSYNLNLIDNLNASNDFTLTPSDSTLVEDSGAGLSATATGLYYNYNVSGEFLIQANSPGPYSGNRYFCFSSGVFACLEGETIAPQYIYSDGANQTGLTGNVPLDPQPTPPPATTPEPAAVGLIGFGIGALGLVRRWRR